MDASSLEKAGLTHNEAKTYIALCQAGSITAGKLSKRVDIHRSRMYEALDRLVRMGLVQFLNINNIKNYKAEPPIKIIDMLKEKQENVEKIIPKLTSLQQQPEIIQKISGYQGITGVKTLLKETLNTSSYVVYGAPQSSIDLLGETFWKNYNQKINDKKISTRMIFDEALRSWSAHVKDINKSTKIKYLSKHFDNLTETFVFDNKVIIITWSAQPLGVLITEKTIAKSYEQFFNMLWQQAKA